jgi:hypothetical protein
VITELWTAYGTAEDLEHNERDVLHRIVSVPDDRVTNGVKQVDVQVYCDVQPPAAFISVCATTLERARSVWNEVRDNVDVSTWWTR